jgi:predicted nucleotidyltransferase
MIRFKKLPQNIHQNIDSLTSLLKNDHNIIFAYLFGGLLRDKENPLSDVDIAVYIKDIKKLNYLDVFGNITDVLCTDEVDLVILNNSPISLTGRVLQSRMLLIDKNPFLRHRFESVTLRKYFDFVMKERDIMKRRYGIG